ncbi:MAG: hypothetical protein K1X48_11500 [Burkholderiaceae bacterium]|nr:hypothetical protein [Burkholderiaceae bacterium]
MLGSVPLHNSQLPHPSNLSFKPDWLSAGTSLIGGYTWMCRTLTLTAVLASLLCTACASDTSVVTPFPLGKEGARVTAEVQVKERLIYAATLRYTYKEDDATERVQQWKLAGGSTRSTSGKWIEPCAELELRVKIRQLDPPADQPLAEKTVKRPCLSSWGANSLNSELFAVKLAPGRYEFSVESLAPAPAFTGARTSLYVGRAYRGK